MNRFYATLEILEGPGRVSRRFCWILKGAGESWRVSREVLWPPDAAKSSQKLLGASLERLGARWGGFSSLAGRFAPPNVKEANPAGILGEPCGNPAGTMGDSNAGCLIPN